MGQVKAPKVAPVDPFSGTAIVARLVEGGTPLALATMYADLFLEYREAQRNIRANGVIVQHPRTMNPIENPYLGRRDKARAGLLAMRVRADWLWEALLEEAAEPPSGSG